MVIEAWFGYDSFGRAVNTAKRDDGVWFERHSYRTIYGPKMTKWERFDPSFDTHGENKYTGESFEYDEPIMMWGFSKLERYGEAPKFRLPHA